MLFDANNQAIYVFESDTKSETRLLRRVRRGVAARLHRRRAGRRRRASTRRSSERQAPRRQAPGDLRRPAALLLRARGAGRGPLPQRRPERRPLVGRRAPTASAAVSRAARPCVAAFAAAFAWRPGVGRAGHGRRDEGHQSRAARSTGDALGTEAAGDLHLPARPAATSLAATASAPRTGRQSSRRASPWPAAASKLLLGTTRRRNGDGR